MTNIHEAITLFATEQSLLPQDLRKLRFRCGCLYLVRYEKRIQWALHYVGPGTKGRPCRYHRKHWRGQLPSTLTGRMVKFNAPHLFKKQK